MNKLIFSVLVCLLLTSKVFSQENLIFDFDYAQFRNDTVSNSVEFYYSFNQSAFKNSNGSFFAYMQIMIKDELTDELVSGKRYLINQPFTDSTFESVIGTFIIPLKEGKYLAEIIIKDSLNHSVADTVVEKIKVLPLQTNKMSISDIELSTNILEDSTKAASIFYKNSFEVTPLPTSVYNTDINPVLFFYTELYNMNSITHEIPLKMHYYVFNSLGKPVFSKFKEIPHKLESRVEVGYIPIYKFPNDTYTLTITVIDSATNYGIRTSKKFFIYNPKMKIEQLSQNNNISAIGSEFGNMSEEELDDSYEKTKYLLSKSEVDKYKTLKGVDSKREFLFQYWKGRDNDPSTPQSETYREYLHSIELANQRYSSTTKIGWKSDRGRVYILYGEPSEIERFPNQVDTKPYEIWHYNDIEGGIVFVFADVSGFSEYLLLHSTKRGELRDDNWQRRIESF